MGFDLYGMSQHHAQDEELIGKGAYFRARVGGWRPLRELVAEMARDTLSLEDVSEGWVNNGHLIEEDKAVVIADRLKEMIDSGDLTLYIAEPQRKLDALPLEECEYCDGTGTRDDVHVKGKCNGCEGAGKTKAFVCWYSLREQSVRDFEYFCRHSGGFEIR